MLLNSQFGMISLFNTLQSIIDVVEYRDQILIIKKPLILLNFLRRWEER